MRKLSGVRWAEIRQILAGVALLCGAGLLAANLFCAIRYGAVFWTKGSSDWACLDSDPYRFFYSVAASLGAPLFALIGVELIRGVRDERRFRANLPFRPRYEDAEHTSNIEP